MNSINCEFLDKNDILFKELYMKIQYIIQNINLNSSSICINRVINMIDDNGITVWYYINFYTDTCYLSYDKSTILEHFIKNNPRKRKQNIDHYS